jgi:HEPN domain-containing protein/predicted nucleotidyltransferase
MKTSLSHLPEHKQQEILKIVEIIKEVARPEKLVLFGSYARGNWVEDRYFENGIRYEYISDYDFLVVTKNNIEKEYILSDKIVNRARHVTNVAVNPIIHDMDYVNEGLEIGQYFFTDIVKEGVLLFDSAREGFAQARELSVQEQKEIANRDFDRWFPAATNFLDFSNYGAKKLGSDGKKLNDVAFLLHQTTERLYNTVLLVFTGYKPKTHNLEKLRQYAKPYSKELIEIFPDSTDDKLENHLFDLLKRGYIDARYKDDYMITKEELEMLIKKVEKMKSVVEGISKEKIDSMGN